MNRAQRLNIAHVALQEWADWVISHMDTSTIGYPSQSVEGRLIADGGIRSGQPPAPIVPNVMMRKGIAKVDRAVRWMPRNMRHVIQCKYLEFGTEGEKLRKWLQAGGDMKAYYYLWDEGREEVAKAILDKGLVQPKKINYTLRRVSISNA